MHEHPDHVAPGRADQDAGGPGGVDTDPGAEPQHPGAPPAEEEGRAAARDGP